MFTYTFCAFLQFWLSSDWFLANEMRLEVMDATSNIMSPISSLSLPGQAWSSGLQMTELQDKGAALLISGRLSIKNQHF